MGRMEPQGDGGKAARATRRRGAPALAATALLVAAAAGALPAGATEDGTVVAEVPIYWDPEGDPLHAGQEVAGALQRTEATADGVAMTVTTTGLEAGHAYTLWLVFFNNPEACRTGGETFRCSVLDMANGDTDVHAIWCNGVAGWTGPSHVLECFWPPGVPQTEEGKLAAGTGELADPRTAEYHAQLLDHGPYDPARWGEDQWEAHDGGCVVQDDGSLEPDGVWCEHAQGNMLSPGK